MTEKTTPLTSPITVGIDYADTSRMAVRGADGTVQVYDVHDVHLPEMDPSGSGDVVDTAAVFDGSERIVFEGSERGQA